MRAGGIALAQRRLTAQPARSVGGERVEPGAAARPDHGP